VSEACEMLAPLAYQESAEKLKPQRQGQKKPWHWNSIHQIAFDNVKIYHKKRGSAGLSMLFEAL